MMTRRSFMRAGAALAAVHASRIALAQTDAVRLIVPFATGGTSDIIARLLGVHAANHLGRTIVVENKAGASGAIGLRAVASAPPDGRTLLLGNISTQAIAPHLLADKQYPGIEEFSSLVLTGRTTNLIVVHPSTGIHNWDELRRYMQGAKAPVPYATGSHGGSPHLSFELLRQRMGWQAEHIAYKGAGPMITDVLGGHVKIAVDNLPALLPHVRSGALVAIAVTSAKRWPGAEQIATLAELGVQDYDVTAWFGVFAPAKLPGDLASPIARAFTAAQQDADVRARFAALGAIADPQSGDTFARFVEAQYKLWGAVIKNGNIRGA